MFYACRTWSQWWIALYSIDVIEDGVRKYNRSLIVGLLTSRPFLVAIICIRFLWFLDGILNMSSYFESVLICDFCY